jgi:hypothetical protein
MCIPYYRNQRAVPQPGEESPGCLKTDLTTTGERVG